MILDTQGWGELSEILERALFEAIAVQESAKERLAAGDEAGTSCTVSILGYTSVGGQKKVGPPSDAKELASAAQAKMKKPKTKGKGRSTRRSGRPKAKKRGGK